MYFASAFRGSMTDIRQYTVCSGTTFSSTNIVLAANSDDTDQGGTAQIACAATFVLPYVAGQKFHVTFTRGSGTTPPLYVWAIGFQV
jgi:hypothetical protein